MALRGRGLQKRELREYVWAGDTSIDRDASDFTRWYREGGADGLVYLSDQKPTVLRCKPLTRTLWECAKNVAVEAALVEAKSDPSPAAVDFEACCRKHWPAVYRMVVAYSVTKIENGPALTRVHDGNAMRLTDALLDELDGEPAIEVNGDEVTLLGHLGALIVVDTVASLHEGKV